MKPTYPIKLPTVMRIGSIRTAPGCVAKLYARVGEIGTHLRELTPDSKTFSADRLTLRVERKDLVKPT